MDPRQFDKLSKSVATGLSRRALVSGAGGGFAAGLFGGRGWRQSLAANSNPPICDLDFTATVLVGPSGKQKSTKVIKGELTLAFGKDGAIDDAKLVGADGKSSVVVGQATGRSISLWLKLPGGASLQAFGVAEHAIAGCTGPMRGTFRGPKDDDLGEWIASLKKSGTSANGTATATSGSVATAGAVQPTEAGSAPTDASEAPTPCALQCVGDTLGLDEANCTCACADGKTPCISVSENAGSCFDITSDVGNCGACFNECPFPSANADAVCVNGQCAQKCQDGFDDCTPGACTASVCVDVHGSDLQNCGGCGEACGTGAIACESGQCVCQACPSGSTAEPGTCTCVCNSGLTECDGGGCVDLTTDRANCGACGNACRAAASCQGGACVCQNTCDPSQTLDPATCACACGSGLVDCGGVCADLTSDPSHCGVCGRHCTSKFPDCSNGECVALNS